MVLQYKRVLLTCLDLGIRSGKVRNFWRQKDLGDCPDKFTAKDGSLGVTLGHL